MTTAQIEAENTQMTNDLYRLLKKYSGLRNLIRQLKVSSVSLHFKGIFLTKETSQSLSGREYVAYPDCTKALQNATLSDIKSIKI